MTKCAYCSKPATGSDALGIDACIDHLREADEYYEQRTGRKPDEDAFLYCEKHGDKWYPECARCEACCQHHYNMPVATLYAIKANEHTASCKCYMCRVWWKTVGPDEDGLYGPFGKSID